MEKCLKIIDSARKKIYERMTYLVQAIYMLEPEESTKIKTMATDGLKLYYNPEFVLNNSTKSCIEKHIIHIICHCMLGHMFYTDNKNKALYDAACDYEVSLMVEKMKMRLFAECRPQEYNKLKNILPVEMGAENIYTKSLGNPSISFLINSMSNKLIKDDHSIWYSSKSENSTVDTESVKKNKNEAQKLWENITKTMYFSNSGDSKGNEGSNAFERFKAAKENKISYKEFLNGFVSSAELPKSDPESFDYISYTIGMEYTETCPFIEPADTREEKVCDEFVIAVDTSGSCYEYASQFLRETCNIICSCCSVGQELNIRIMQCDSEISNERVIHSVEDIIKYTECGEMSGFGGTSFVPVFNRIEQLRKSGEMVDVKGLIYLSDGCGDFPKKKTDYETIFVIPDEDHNVLNMVPDWVTKIRLKENEITKG